MKKKLLTLLIFGALSASLMACGDSAEAETTISSEIITETQETTAPTESTTETVTETETVFETELITESESLAPIETEPSFSFESLGMSIPVPESWTMTSSSTNGDITDIQYSSGTGIVRIYVVEYSEDIASMSDILLDGTLSSYKKDNTYIEIEQNDIKVDGKNGHATAFYYQDYFCFLTAINSGRSIVTFFYRGTLDASEELDTYSKMVDNTKFDISSDSENNVAENEPPTSETELQVETVSLETESQTEYVEQVWIPNSGSKYHSNSSCSNMNSPTQVSKSEAEQMGYTPCKRCH